MDSDRTCVHGVSEWDYCIDCDIERNDTHFRGASTDDEEFGTAEWRRDNAADGTCDDVQR